MLDRGPGTRTDYEAMLQQLVGRSIRALSYFEIPYEVVEPMWNRDSESFDSLDFGLEMLLDDDTIFSVTWGTEFTQYNVSIRREPLQFADAHSARRWEVSERWRARHLLDSKIVSARASWLAAFPPAPAEYPQDLRIECESGSVVVISAFEFRRGEISMGQMDNITVFFDEAEARRLVDGDSDGAP